MAAPEFDPSAPATGGFARLGIDKIRENEAYLLIMAAGAGYMLPGFETTVEGSDKSQPDSITLTHSDNRRMRFVFTWSSGILDKIKYQFDKGLGDGLEDISLGTLTLAYDASGNFTGATPS